MSVVHLLQCCFADCTRRWRASLTLTLRSRPLTGPWWETSVNGWKPAARDSAVSSCWTHSTRWTRAPRKTVRYSYNHNRVFQTLRVIDKSWPENNYVQQFLLFCQSKCLTTFAKIFWNFYWKIKEIFCHTFLLSSRYWKESQKKVWQPLIWFGKLLNNLVFIWLQPCNKVFIWLCHGIIIVHGGGGGQCACNFLDYPYPQINNITKYWIIFNPIISNQTCFLLNCEIVSPQWVKLQLSTILTALI